MVFLKYALPVLAATQLALAGCEYYDLGTIEKEEERNTD